MNREISLSDLVLSSGLIKRCVNCGMFFDASETQDYLCVVCSVAIDDKLSEMEDEEFFK